MFFVKLLASRSVTGPQESASAVRNKCQENNSDLPDDDRYLTRIFAESLSINEMRYFWNKSNFGVPKINGKWLLSFLKVVFV